GAVDKRRQFVEIDLPALEPCRGGVTSIQECCLLGIKHAGATLGGQKLYGCERAGNRLVSVHCAGHDDATIGHDVEVVRLCPVSLIALRPEATDFAAADAKIVALFGGFPLVIGHHPLRPCFGAGPCCEDAWGGRLEVSLDCDCFVLNAACLHRAS